MERDEQRPLRWPEGWPRTRFQDRSPKPAWKKNFAQSLESLDKELRRLGATSRLVTRNDQANEDAGVAVWISLKPIDNYGWQEALGFIGEVPTVQDIDRAYMKKVQPIHPDGPTPNLEQFHALTAHRDRARAWARGQKNVEHEKVIACDAFTRHEWNLTAIRLTIYAMRMMERCGATAMTERAWRGFSKQITAGSGAEHVTAVA